MSNHHHIPNQDSSNAVAAAAVTNAPAQGAAKVTEAQAHNQSQNLSMNNGHRHHFRRLKNLFGFFIVRYSADAKIMGFFGGALRAPISEESQRIYSYTPRALMQAFTEGNMRPEPTIHEVEGHRGVTVDIYEVEAYTALIRSFSPAEFDAGAWGVVSVGPNPTKHILNGVINGEFNEQFLEPTRWRELEGSQVPNAGGNDLHARLHDNALTLAGLIPTALDLAATGSLYFGGMTAKPWVSHPLTQPVVDMARREEEVRTQNRIRRAQQRAEYNIRANAGNSFSSMTDPETLAKMQAAIDSKG